MEEVNTYSIGDWVVHTNYGVGQIKAIELKPFHGKKVECFKAKTKDCTFWFPTEKNGNPRIRPISSQDYIQKVIKSLRRKPANFDKDKKFWKTKIKKVKTDGDMIDVCKLVRDLTAQGTKRNLVQSEEKALAYLKERLLREWAVIVGSKVDEVRPQLQAYIQESKAKIPLEA
jgi:RNA polymerase-interacting CarD/CdnL/TRCF family regulator